MMCSLGSRIEDSVHDTCFMTTALIECYMQCLLQCWVDIDTSSASYVDVNGRHWDQHIAYFESTSTSTWIQILGNDNPDQLYIDDITMSECL